GNLVRGNIPVTHQVILEGRRHDYNAFGMTVKKSRYGAQGAMKQGPFAARTDGRKRFRPKIADLEDEGDTFPQCDPPAGKRAQQLRRSRDNDVRLTQRQSADGSREAERDVVADSFVRLPIRQRPQPCANDAHSIDSFGVVESTQP